MNGVGPDEGILDRAQGALVGLAAGDALGTTVEFQAPGTFEPVVDIVGGGPFGLEPGQWTDDTSMAGCLAESILDTGGHDPVDQLRRYVAWWRHGRWSSTGTCFDIGITTRDQLARFEATGEAIDPDIDQEAAANGSLMRLAGVPIRWWADPAAAAEWSGRSSMTTHPARRPVDACRVLGAMTAALIGGADASDVFTPDFWDLGPLHPRIEQVARGSWREKEPPGIRGTGYCVDALEAALWAVGGARTFADAVRRAANLGDDADTTAAIAGQLAGARWGRSGIPAAWSAILTDQRRLASVSRALAVAGGAAAPADRSGRPRWVDDDLVAAWWVRPGRVLIGEYPGRADVSGTDAVLELLVDQGVRTFVDLTTSPGGQPYGDRLPAIVEARGFELEHLAHPIPNMGVLDDTGYDAIVAAIDRASERGVVYVHCVGGIGRAGTVAGCLLVDDGFDGQAALARIAELRAGTRKARYRSPQTAAQEAVIARRAARLHD